MSAIVPASDEKPFEVTISIRNNHLKSRRLQARMSQKALAKAIGIAVQYYSDLECLRRSPLVFSGQCRVPDCSNVSKYRWLCDPHHEPRNERFPRKKTWSKHAKAIARFWEVEPGKLFPEAVCQVSTNRIVATASAKELQRSPEDAFMELETSKTVRAVLGTLDEKEADIIRRRFGLDGEEETLEQVADAYGVGRERIRQIELRALRKLQHPKRQRALRGERYLDFQAIVLDVEGDEL